MGIITLSIPQTGLPNSTEDVKIANDFTAVQTVINGNIDTANLSSAVAAVISGVFAMTRGHSNAPTGTTTITHGLGTTPTAILLGPISSSGSASRVQIQLGTYTTTTFQIVNPDVSSDFFWLAVA